MQGPDGRGRNAQEKENAMSYPNSRLTDASRPQPPKAADEFDSLLIDDEFDDLLDRQLAAIRESHADYRSL
jgi:hypothetical protein